MKNPWQNILRFLGQTHGEVELSPDRQDHRDTAPAWRCRLLAFDGQCIVLQRPDAPGASRQLRSGEPVAVGFEGDHEPWLLLTHVRGMSHFQLADQTRVPAVVLEHPHTVRRGQRRESYRAPAADGHVHSVAMLPDRDDAADEARAFNATLLNVSRGGIGISTPSNVGSKMAIGDKYNCRIVLLMPTFPLMVPVVVQRIHETERGRHHIGLRFNFAENEPGSQRLIDELCRFADHLHRIQIRMTRQKQ
jgi:c-di-GMP-binding flagellar brake protein YcgR